MFEPKLKMGLRIDLELDSTLFLYSTDKLKVYDVFITMLKYYRFIQVSQANKTSFLSTMAHAWAGERKFYQQL